MPDSPPFPKAQDAKGEGVTMANDGDLDLNALNDDELVQQMHDDLYDGLKEEIENGGATSCSSRGWTPYDVLTKALVEGMRIVGVDFRDGILFVPEVLLAANAMKAGMFILRPLLAETGAPKVGKMVIGTVKGDIHDIGKNLVSMMMEGAGFEVIDLGINNPVEKYLEAIEEHQPDILGMSALLDHHHALHEGRHRHDERKGHPRRLRRAGRRCAAQRGLRQGGRRRRLLPRRGRGRRNRQVVHGEAPGFGPLQELIAHDIACLKKPATGLRVAGFFLITS